MPCCSWCSARAAPTRTWPACWASSRVAVRDRAVRRGRGARARCAGALAPERRAEIVDFLLGQAPPVSARRTREYLAASAGGRAWARAVAGELRPLNLGELPEIPDEADAPPAAPPRRRPPPRTVRGTAPASRPAPRARRREPEPALGEPAARPPARERASSSRIGGALSARRRRHRGRRGADHRDRRRRRERQRLLAGHHRPGSSTARPPPPRRRPEAQAQPPATGKALGVAQIVSQQGKQAPWRWSRRALPASPQGYAVWLYNSRDRTWSASATQAVGQGRQARRASPPAQERLALPRARRLAGDRQAADEAGAECVLRGPLRLS